MSEQPRNPYRAAGTFNGEVYIEREADERLLKEIRNNDSYPYFCAPRQSGKSSLIAHTISRLDDSQMNPGYKAIQVDLSSFEVDFHSNSPQADSNQRIFVAYDGFLRNLLLILSKKLEISDFEINQIELDDPSVLEDLLVSWQKRIQKRLVIFLDEFDTLQDAPFKETFLNKLRFIFNQRADHRVGESYKQIQFVLSSSLHPTILIPNPLKSPFNVGKEIELADFTKTEVKMLAESLKAFGPIRLDRIVEIIYEHTSGNLYLCQTILKTVWELTREKDGLISPKDVRKIIKDIIANSYQDIHFLNIYNSFQGKAQANLTRSLQRYYATGRPPREEELRGLITTGLCDRQRAFRCQIYVQVFGPRGHHLALVHSSRRTVVLGTFLLALGLLSGYRMLHKPGHFSSDWLSKLRGLAALVTVQDLGTSGDPLDPRDSRTDLRHPDDLGTAGSHDLAKPDLQRARPPAAVSYPPLRFAETRAPDPETIPDCVLPSPSFITGTTEEGMDESSTPHALVPLSAQQKSAVFRVIQNYRFCGNEAVDMKNNDSQLVIDSNQPMPESMKSPKVRIEIAEQLYDEFMKSAIKLPKTVRIQK